MGRATCSVCAGPGGGPAKGEAQHSAAEQRGGDARRGGAAAAVPAAKRFERVQCWNRCRTGSAAGPAGSCAPEHRPHQHPVPALPSTPASFSSPPAPTLHTHIHTHTHKFAPPLFGFQGDNAWLFIQEDVISESVKAYVDFEAKLKEKLPKEEREKARPIDVSGALGALRRGGGNVARWGWVQGVAKRAAGQDAAHRRVGGACCALRRGGACWEPLRRTGGVGGAADCCPSATPPGARAGGPWPDMEFRHEILAFCHLIPTRWPRAGGVMSGKALTYEEVKRLEKLPTKQQLIATIARLIKQVRGGGGGGWGLVGWWWWVLCVCVGGGVVAAVQSALGKGGQCAVQGLRQS